MIAAFKDGFAKLVSKLLYGVGKWNFAYLGFLLCEHCICPPSGGRSSPARVWNILQNFDGRAKP